MKLLACILCLGATVASGKSYLPEWDSLVSRPIPDWFDDAKFGVMLMWGLFSVPSFGQEQFWRFLTASRRDPKMKKYKDFMDKNYPPGFSYQDFAPKFKAEFFNATKWIDLCADAGAKYVLMSAKYHDGFAMWPSEYSPGWNAMEVGPKRDLVGEFVKAARQSQDLRYGFYHSLSEYFHPDWLKDKANKYATHEFSKNKVTPELKDLVETYKPDIVWSDGHWLAAPGYWNETALLAWLYNESPVRDTVVTNDFWAKKVPGEVKGGFFTLFRVPKENVGRKWELWMLMDKMSGGYRREAALNDILTPQQIIEKLIMAVSTGGNLLLVVGPSEEGLVRPLYEETLREVGAWLKVNGEAIYKSRAAKIQTGLESVRYTARESLLYALILKKPKNNLMKLPQPFLGQNSTVTLLGYEGEIMWHRTAQGLRVVLPEAFRCFAPTPWVLKLTNVGGQIENKTDQPEINSN